MIVFLIYALALVVLLKVLGFFRLENFRGFGLYGVLFVKVLIAILLYHFPMENMKDSSTYLNDSLILSEVLLNNPKEFFVIFFHLPGADMLDLKYMLDTNYWSHETSGLISEKRNVIRVNTIFQILGFQNPYIVFFWNALTAILGLKLLYRSLRSICKDDHNVLFTLVFLLPSTLLWTSNIMKESYLILGFGLFFYGLLVPMRRNKKVLLATLGFLVVLMFKQYVALGLLAGLVVYLLILLPTRGQRITGFSFFFVLLLFGGFLFLPRFTERISAKQFDFIRLAEGGIVLNDLGTFYKIELADSDHFDFFYGADKNLYAHILEPVKAVQQSHDKAPQEVLLGNSDKLWYVYNFNDKSGSYISLTPIENNSIQLLKNIPEALVNVFFRPLPLDPPKSVTKWYFFLENVAIWGLFIFSLRNLRKSKQLEIITLFIIASLVVALLIGWTTPVIGAIVRYKLPIVLSLIAVSWLLLFPNKALKQQAIS